MRGLPLLVAAAVGGASAMVPPLGGMVGAVSPTDIETPRAGFPGATAAASDATFPSGKQPVRLQYWPQLHYGLANRTLLGCWKVQVLHDTQKEWPGLCVNLAPNREVAATEAACRTFCENEPRCPVWQFANQTSPGQCWVGFGTNCANRKGRGADISVQAAQRIMHGDVRVLMDLRGWKINHLYQIGFFDSGDDVLGVDRCKAWCYSTIGCQYWQYSAAAGGCFVDAPMFSTQRNSKPNEVVQYPLTTTGGASPNAAFQDGEYITHYCPPLPQETTQAPAAPIFDPGRSTTQSSGGLFSGNLFWVGAPLLLLAAAAGGVYLFMQQSGGKGGKKKYSSRNAYAPRDDSGQFGYEDDNQPLMNLGSYPQPPPPPPQYQGGARGGPAPYGGRPPAGPGSASFAQQQQQHMAPTTYGPGVGRGMPPPTQIMDMGQTPSLGSQRPGPSAMAPTQQLFSQGMPFPAPPGR